jgi:hypothetical protein
LAAEQRGIVGYFKSHPILLLLILTPGIPEYLTGSSALNNIILNPPLFLFELVANLCLYGPGVLLIREAKVRWHKGWATVLLLGAAYGILEEGIALSTLYNSHAGPVGQLGFYGHWLGVNWIWTVAIVVVHMIYSISLPILLLGLALPETNGKSLLKTDRSIAWTFGILTFDVFSLLLVIRFGEHFWMGTPVFLGSLAAIGLFIYLARKAPANVLIPKKVKPTIRPPGMGVIGALFYPTVLIVEFVGRGAKLPPAGDFVLVILDQALYLALVLRVISRSNNERHLVAFAAGLLVPIGLFGYVSEIKLPLSLLAVAIAVALLWMLWRKYPKSNQTVEDPRVDPPLLQ